MAQMIALTSKQATAQLKWSSCTDLTGWAQDKQKLDFSKSVC